MSQGPERALGKLPPRHDRRTLHLGSYLRAERFTAPPPLRDWIDHSHAFDVLGNDKIGDCAFAAQAHLLQCFAAANERQCLVGKDEVIGAYSRVTGYVPGKPVTDHGTVMLDALSDWRKVGLAGHAIEAYVRLDIANRTHIEGAINLLGGIYLGVALPEAARTQTVWDVAPPDKYDHSHAPGSWGGHAVACCAYSRTGLVFVTWGKLKIATWEWLLTYSDEAYAVISPDWCKADDLAPNGFDIAALRADLAALGV